MWNDFKLPTFFPTESNVAILSKEKGPHDICEALKSHIGCVSLVESACSALWSLSMEGR